MEPHGSRMGAAWEPIGTQVAHRAGRRETEPHMLVHDKNPRIRSCLVRTYNSNHSNNNHSNENNDEYYVYSIQISLPIIMLVNVFLVFFNVLHSLL